MSKLKVLTVLGTRPEIIRLSRIIEKLDALSHHVLVHTGQNFDSRLSDVFFEELRVRKPDHHLGVRGTTPGEQIGQIIVEMERVLQAERPDRLLILGDTNSGLAAIVAKRMGITVCHMEAGNRCFDDRVPEEVNRRIIDHCSDVLMPYTERSRANLLREGFEGNRVFVTGNPIREVLVHFEAEVRKSRILATLGLEPRQYFLVTAHRAENVDKTESLRSLTEAFQKLNKRYEIPVIVSTHPRTKSKLDALGIGSGDEGVRYMPAFGFMDFVTLEQNARCVLSDSGTVQEEAAIFGVPNVIIREVTERPETLECGSGVLSGVQSEQVVEAVAHALTLDTSWEPPPEYMRTNVSSTVIKLVLGFN